jgi:hypothetical protein
MMINLFVFPLEPGELSGNKYSLAVSDTEAEDFGIVKTRRSFPTIEAVMEFVEKICAPGIAQSWKVESPKGQPFRWMMVTPESAKAIEQEAI